MEPVLSKLNTSQSFALDIETTGLSPFDSRILLCQIGFPDKVYVINALDVSLAPLVPYLGSNKWRKIIQNAKFEEEFFLHYFDTRINNVFDTKIAEQLISGGAYSTMGGNSLWALAQKYANRTLDKSVTMSFVKSGLVEFSKEQLDYAAADVEVLWPILEAQEPKLEELGLAQVADIEFRLTNVVASMEHEGVPIDIEKWEAILEDYRKRHEESRLRMHELLFSDANEQIGMFERSSINLNSPKQVKQAFESIGIELDATNERIIGLIDHPAAQELLNYRSLQKVLSSYGETFLGAIHPFTRRIHPDWGQIGTDTGRFSCKSPNLQQMPEEFRECVSLKDHKIIAADYSQMELRILAELSQDPAFIDAFHTGHDLHTSTAASMFNIPIEKVTKDQRFVAKTINFGLAYGMGANKLMDILNYGKSSKEQLSYAKVRELFSRYRKTYSKNTQWLMEAGQLAYRRGYSETLGGRKRFYIRPVDGLPESERDRQISHIKRQGANSPIQGTNADITKLAMNNLHEDLTLNGYSAKIILQVHDEIVVLAHKRAAEPVKELVKESMTKSAQVYIKSVPVVVDAYISDIWKKG